MKVYNQVRNRLMRSSALTLALVFVALLVRDLLLPNNIPVQLGDIFWLLAFCTVYELLSLEPRS